MARVLLAVPSLHTQIEAHHESKKQNATEIFDGYMLNLMNCDVSNISRTLLPTHKAKVDLIQGLFKLKACL